MEFVVPSTIGNNPLYITINDTKYTLGPGTTVDVPQAVITEVQRMLAALSKEAPAVEPPFAGGSSGGGVLFCEGVFDSEAGTVTLNKTWKELYDAKFAVCLSPFSDGGEGFGTSILSDAGVDTSGGHWVTFAFLYPSSSMEFSADAEDGYPVAHLGG